MLNSCISYDLLFLQLSEPSGIVETENGDSPYPGVLFVRWFRKYANTFNCFPSHFVGRLYIADTNNNLIRYLNLNEEKAQVLTLELKGVQPPVPKSRSMKRLRRRSSDTETVVVPGGSSNEGSLGIKISVPEGYHFSKVLTLLYSLFFSFFFHNHFQS